MENNNNLKNKYKKELKEKITEIFAQEIGMMYLTQSKKDFEKIIPHIATIKENIDEIFN